MSATFAVLKTAVASAVRDSGYDTFLEAEVGDFVNAALSEVGRISPEQFHESITLVADTLEYTLLSGTFDVAVPEIEVARVELWQNVTDGPDQRLAVVHPASRAWSADSQSGWVNWGGVLYLPHSVWSLFDGNEATYYLRVWGYAPFAELVIDADVANVSVEQKYATIAFARIEALERLNADRELFSQWQTRAGNSDISPAGLMNMLSIARDDWRRRKRELLRLRSAV